MSLNIFFLALALELVLRLCNVLLFKIKYKKIILKFNYLIRGIVFFNVY